VQAGDRCLHDQERSGDLQWVQMETDRRLVISASNVALSCRQIDGNMRRSSI